MTPLHTDNLVYLNQLQVIADIDALKTELDSLRPISKEQEGRIIQKFRLDWNYNSNAIEGNSLDYGETTAFLMHGVTAKGKPLKDYLDIRGHNKAIDYLLDLIKNHEQQLSESDIRSLHEMLLVEPYDNQTQTQEGIVIYKRIKLGQYKTTPNHVKTITGEIHYYASPEDTPILMSELIDWFRKAVDLSILHPVIIAAIFHHRFTAIHPFDDGNGRMSRLLMNLILMQYELPPIIIKNENRNEYFLTLSQADTGDNEAFVNYIGKNMLHSLQIYIKGAKGESIDESLDIDKKLLLFKKELEERKDRVEHKRTLETKFQVIENSLKPLMNEYLILIAKFKDLFLDYKEYIIEYNKQDILDASSTKWLWNYQPLSISNFTKEFAYFKEKDMAILCSSFNNFKLETNPFSLEVKFLIVFNELQYSIYYTISIPNEILGLTIHGYDQWLGRPFFSKYYHKPITQTETDRLIKELGNDLFDFTKELYTDPQSKSIQTNKEEMIDYWSNFIHSNKSLDETISEKVKTPYSVYFKDNIINIDLTSEAFELIKNIKENLEDSFSAYLIKNKHSPVRPIVVITK